MRKVYTMCNVKRKDDTEVQIIGNNVQRHYDGNGNEITCVGGTFFGAGKFLISDLKYDEGVIFCEAQIEAEPFQGYTHQVWIYGVERNARVSLLEPYYIKEKGVGGNRMIMACGDWHLDSWSDNEFFTERKGEIMKVYLKVSRTDATVETDYDYDNKK